MNIKKLISCIMAIFAAIIVAITLTACGGCNGNVNENDGDSQSESAEKEEFEVGGEIPGIEITIPKDEQ